MCTSQPYYEVILKIKKTLRRWHVYWFCFCDFWNLIIIKSIEYGYVCVILNECVKRINAFEKLKVLWNW